MRSVGGFAQQVSALVRRHAAGPARAEAIAPPVSIAVTGHSLGAALATLYVLDNALTERIHNPLIYTFASPRVGDSTFASAFNALGLTSWRVDNLPDIVPYFPLGFTHVNSLKQYDSLTAVWPSPTCWHALATYLTSLIDPTLKPDPSCQWLALAQAPTRAAVPSAAKEAAPAATAANRAMLAPMGDLLKLIWWAVIGLFRSKVSLEAEILTLARSRRPSPKQAKPSAIMRREWTFVSDVRRC